jgi:thiol-disulfide isomerase/thioredoxin
MNRLTTITALAAIVLCLATSQPSARELPADFRLEPVASGLTEPWAVAITPDARILIAERTTGNLRVVRRGELLASPQCTVAVDSVGEGGLLGVAVHPRFTERGWIYLYYTDLTSGVNRVTRFTLGGGTGCTDPLTIVADLGDGPGLLRNGGGMAFGPDGKLYVATGDVEVQANGQDTTTPRAKILRINEDGTVPVDNPTPGSLIYARGVRDGRGLTVAPGGQVYATDRGDTGAGVRDELNLATSGGDLGWPAAGTALASWLPTIGAHGVAFYSGAAFPDLDADGIDNDYDRYGLDRFPGKARFDDNGLGVCVGSAAPGSVCDDNSDCPPRAGEATFCEKLDEPAEYCPGGVPFHDDACGSTGSAGIDEPNESFQNNLLLAAQIAGSPASGEIRRATLTGAGLDQISAGNMATFLDSTPFNPTAPPPAITDCPTNWTGVATGRDGFLYLLARNTGGATGGLYRVIHDPAPGAREVSATGTPFPLRVDKGGIPGEVLLSWEDLRDEGKQVQDDGTNVLPQEREYTIWKGTIGTFYSHVPMAGLEDTPGTEISPVLRRTTLALDPADNEYFLVSARHDNLNGTLGRRSSGPERPGYAVTDLCETIGYVCTDPSAPGMPPGCSPTALKCGMDMNLVDEEGITHAFSELRGKVILLDISAVWCGPCNQQADAMEFLYQDYKDRGAVMVTVLNDDNLLAGTSPADRPNPIECRTWSDREPGFQPDHTFECLVDQGPNGTQQTWPRYFLNAWPTNMVLDQGFRVISGGTGYNEPGIRAVLDALVGTTDSCLH